MNLAQKSHYESLCQHHINALLRQGKADSTIDVCSRAVRRISEYFYHSPDTLTKDNLKNYFAAHVKTYSRSTVKIDRNGSPFFIPMYLKKTDPVSRSSNHIKKDLAQYSHTKKI